MFLAIAVAAIVIAAAAVVAYLVIKKSKDSGSSSKQPPADDGGSTPPVGDSNKPPTDDTPTPTPTPKHKPKIPPPPSPPPDPRLVAVGSAGLYYYASPKPVTTLVAAALAATTFDMGLAATPATWEGVEQVAWAATGIVGDSGGATTAPGVLLDPSEAAPRQISLSASYRGSSGAFVALIGSAGKVGVGPRGTPFLATDVADGTSIYIAGSDDALYVDTAPSSSNALALRARLPGDGVGRGPPTSLRVSASGELTWGGKAARLNKNANAIDFSDAPKNIPLVVKETPL